MFKRRRGRPGRIDTLIGQGVQIQGDLEFEGGLHLDGRVTGCVGARVDGEATLSVSERGRVDGSLMAAHVILHGTVRGDIIATGQVRLGPRSRVEGNVLYGSIEVAAGAEVRGRLVPQSSLTGAASGSETAPPPAPAARMASMTADGVESA